MGSTVRSKGMPEFEGVRNFDRQENGLVPVKVETWEQFVFVNLDSNAAPLGEFPGWAGKASRTARLEQAALLHDEDL